MRRRKLPSAALPVAVFAGAIVALFGCGHPAKTAKLPQADTLIRSAKYQDALVQAESVLKGNDQSADAHRIAGEAYLGLGRLARAYHHLLRAQLLDPKSADVRADLAYVYLLAGTSGAREHALSILDVEPRSLTGLVLLGATATTPAQVDEAIGRLEALQSQFGNDARPRLALGSLYQRKGDLAKAAQYYKDAVTADSLSAETHALLASLYQKQGNATLASREAKTLETLAPRTSPAAIRVAQSYLLYAERGEARTALTTIAAQPIPVGSSASRLVAEMALADSNPTLAAEFSSRILQKDTSDVDALLQSGRVRLLQQKSNEAIAFFERAVLADPGVAPPRYYLGTALFRANKVQDARAQLEQAIELANNYPEALTAFGTLNARAETPRGTIAYADRLVKLNPRSLEARRNLGEALIGAGRADEADKVFRDAATRSPDRAEPHYWLATSLISEGKKAWARSELETALRIAPNLAEAMSQLVALDLAEGKTDSALARVNAQLRVVPQSAALYDLLGSIRLGRNENELAAAAFEKSVQLDPKLAGPRAHLSNAYVMMQKFDMAIQQGEAARKLDPENASTLLALGVAYQTKGDFARARESYQAAMAADPNSTAAANNMAFLLSETNTDQSEAMRYAFAALKFAPNDPHIKDTAGWILYKAGRYIEALPLLQQSADALPNAPAVQYHYGMVAQKTGDTTHARLALALAVAAKIDYPGKDEARKALSLLK
jgi:tetratricopeptide (TPR) repeat protein